MRYSHSNLISAAALLLGMVAGAARLNFAVAHVIVELIGIVVAWAVFTFAWNARRYTENSYLTIVGLSYFFTGSLQLLHLLAHEGLAVVPGYDGNLATQLWLAARVVESGSLAAAPFLMNRRVRPRHAFVAIGIVAGALAVSIFGGVFPDAYVEGAGLTLFKRLAEYGVAVLLTIAIAGLHRHRESFEKGVLRLVMVALTFGIASEFVLTSLLRLDDLSMIAAHLLRLVAWYLMYHAIVKTGLVDPYRVLFRSLIRTRDAEREARKRAEGRAAELEALRANLTDMLQEHESGKLLDAILRRAVGLLDASGGEIWLLDRERQHLTVAVSRNCAPPDRLQKIALGEGIIGVVAGKREPVIVHGNGIGDGRPGAPARERWQGLMAVPLVAAEHLLGVIMVTDYDPLREFTAANLRLFTVFAHQASIAIYNTQLLEEARLRADSDSLTGLHNHRHFFELGRLEVDRALRYHHSLTAMMFDIDHFKRINDTFGHAAGDQVLAAIADLCRKVFRKVDVIGRYGGEEFAVLLPETGPKTAFDAAERLRKAIAGQRIVHDGRRIAVTVSVGVSALGDGCFTPNELLERADRALYHAKQGGRNRVCLWSEPPARRAGHARQRRVNHRAGTQRGLPRGRIPEKSEVELYGTTHRRAVANGGRQ